MTAQLKKTEQTRLHSCVLSRPKGPKIRKKLRKYARVALKISDVVADTSARVENPPEKLKPQRKTKLLGKYRHKQVQNIHIIIHGGRQWLAEHHCHHASARGHKATSARSGQERYPYIAFFSRLRFIAYSVFREKSGKNPSLILCYDRTDLQPQDLSNNKN